MEPCQGRIGAGWGIPGVECRAAAGWHWHWHWSRLTACKAQCHRSPLTTHRASQRRTCFHKVTGDNGWVDRSSAPPLLDKLRLMNTSPAAAVKGCETSARRAARWDGQRRAEGRCRTSLDGGNRGERHRRWSMPSRHGDGCVAVRVLACSLVQPDCPEGRSAPGTSPVRCSWPIVARAIHSHFWCAGRADPADGRCTSTSATSGGVAGRS